MRPIGVAVQIIAATATALSGVAIVLDVIADDVASVLSTPFFLTFAAVAGNVRTTLSCGASWSPRCSSRWSRSPRARARLARAATGIASSPMLRRGRMPGRGSRGLFVVVTVGLLRFPDGRPLTPRWRWLERVSVSLIGIFVLAVALSTWGISTRDILSDNEPSAPGDISIFMIN